MDGPKEDRIRERCAKACENCKRRKEKCDGAHPCERCVKRKVPQQCQFIVSAIKRLRRKQGLMLSEETDHSEEVEIAIDRQMNEHRRRPLESIRSSLPTNRFCSAPVPKISRLLRAGDGRFLFVGDSANLSLLQNIRGLVRRAIGTCNFVSDPQRYVMVETVSSEFEGYSAHNPTRQPPMPSLEEVMQLLDYFKQATHCVLDVLSDKEVEERIPEWVNQIQTSWSDPAGAKYFLVCAIGLQMVPEDKDSAAESYFANGRYLAFLHHVDRPSLESVQCHLLITFYLLGASRRNAAFMNFGNAIRAAYSIGLHLREVSELFQPEECLGRERAWRSIRALDGFLSSTLGRPLSTSETRRSMTDGGSAALRICSIGEEILEKVYGNEISSTDIATEISKKHREYVSQLAEGYETDGIPASEYLGEQKLPNVGLVHIRDAFHITIMLLTRPFLLDAVSASIISGIDICNYPQGPSNAPPANQVLVMACVESAIQIISPLRSLCNTGQLPKRLPFVVNAVFLASLIIGISFFANLDRPLLLERHLGDAVDVMRCLSTHDVQAKRFLHILDYLVEACRYYVDKRDWASIKTRSDLVGSLFGKIQAKTDDTVVDSDVVAAPLVTTANNNNELLPSQRTNGRDWGTEGDTTAIGIQLTNDPSPESSAPIHPEYVQTREADFEQSVSLTHSLDIYFGFQSELSPPAPWP